MVAIKALIFDYGGVITNGTMDMVNKVFCEKLAKDLKIKVKPEQVKEIFMANNEKLTTGKLSVKEVCSSIRNKMGWEIDSATIAILYDKAYMETITLNIELLREIKLLQKLFKIGLISNIYDSTAQIEQRRGTFWLFKPCLLSCRIGIRKPDIKIFARALHDLQVKGEEVVFIDNQQDNLDAAKEFGMKTILYKDNKQILKEIMKLPKAKMVKEAPVEKKKKKVIEEMEY